MLEKYFKGPLVLDTTHITSDFKMMINPIFLGNNLVRFDVPKPAKSNLFLQKVGDKKIYSGGYWNYSSIINLTLTKQYL